MIDPSRMHAHFRQPDNGCVLAAYAVANHYFTGRPPSDAFIAYFDHFNNPREWPMAGDNFFSHALTHGGPSTPWLLRIHETSDVDYFRNAREAFQMELIDARGPQPEHVEQLRRAESLMGAAYRPVGGGMVHVITVGVTGDKFVVKDSNHHDLKDAATWDAVLDLQGTALQFTDGAIYTAEL